MNKRVFISYNHGDRVFVARLANDLQNAGLDIWLDELEIRVGESIVERVSEGIAGSAYLIVVLSPQSVKSKWVRYELGSAKMRSLSGKRNIAILPVLLANCRIPGPIMDLKYADFRTDYDAGKEQLLRTLTGQAPVGPSAEPPADLWPKRIWNHLRDPGWQEAAAIIAIVSLLAVLWSVFRATPLPAGQNSGTPSVVPTLASTAVVTLAPTLMTTEGPSNAATITSNRPVVTQTQTPTPLPVPTPDVLYRVDPRLLKNESGDCGRFEYSPGDNAWHLRVTCLHSSAATSFGAVALHDFDYHVTAAKISGSNRAWYGLVMTTVTDTITATHRFMISGVGNYTYEIEKRDSRKSQSDLQIVIPSAYSPAIHTADALNTLLLRRQGSKVELHVNGRLVLSVDRSLPEGLEAKIGVVVITQKDDKGGDDFVEASFKDIEADRPLTQSLTTGTGETPMPDGGADSLLYRAEFKFWSSTVTPCYDYQYIPDDDSYRIRVKCLKTMGSGWPSTISFRDFDASVSATKISGSNQGWYGFILRVQRGQMRYDHRFLLSGAGTASYEVGTMDESEKQTGLDIVVPAQESKGAHQGDAENLLRLVRRGNKIDFWINGVLQVSTTAALDDSEQVQIALAVLTQDSQQEGAFVEVGFRNFAVTKPS